MIVEQRLIGKDLHVEPSLLKHLLKTVLEYDGTLMRKFMKRRMNIPYYDRLISLGPIDLSGLPVRFLPDNMIVRGDLRMSNCKSIRHLPEKLQVKGSLFMDESSIEELPTDIKIEKDLHLSGCKQIKELPFNLNLQDGSLFIDHSSVRSLPDNSTLSKTKKYFDGAFYVSDNIVITGSAMVKNKKGMEKALSKFKRKLVI